MLDIYVTMLFYRVTHLDVWLYRKIFSTRNVNAVFSCAQLDWDFQHDEPTLLGFFCFNIFPALENFQTPWYFDFSFFCSIKLIFDDKSSSFFTKQNNYCMMRKNEIYGGKKLPIRKNTYFLDWISLFICDPFFIIWKNTQINFLSQNQ